jgi:tetratricopeptide (TPR) repeat protein
MRRLLAPPILLILSLVHPIAAQELALKRSLPPAIPAICDEEVGNPLPPLPGAAVEAERLRSSAQQAALLGEPAQARALLERAISLDPTAAQLAYHHARILEALGQSTAAFGEYCRYLRLAPESAESAEIGRHLTAIAPLRPPFPVAAMTAFSTGIRHFDAGDFEDATLAFATVIADAPEWAAAYYNRALALLARDSLAAAALDLQNYLNLAPEEDDRDAVIQLHATLTTPPPPPPLVRRFNPVLGLGTGILLPGLGQFYTRRPTPGLLTLASAGGAIFLALRPSSAYSSPSARERPYLEAGISAAAAITLLSAIEATIYAAREKEPTAIAHGRTARIQLAPPALQATGAGLRADIGMQIRM